MAMRKVQSRDNPLIKEALGIRERRSRHRHGAFLLEGPNLLQAALDAGDRGVLRRVFATGRFMGRSPALIDRLLESGVEVVEVTDSVIRRLSTEETPQGVAAIASYRPPTLDGLVLAGISVLCDGIREPGNLGAIVRTADALGAEAVALLPGTCDAFSPKALRASAGSVFNIPLVYAAREALPAILRKMGVRLLSTDPHRGVEIRGADLAPPVALAFGGEAAGISPELRAASDLVVRIPVRGKAESLNVAASAAIVLYEASRRLPDSRRQDGDY